MLSVPPPPKRLSTLLPPSAPRVLSLAHPNATLSSTSSAATSFARYQTYFPKKSISLSTLSSIELNVGCSAFGRRGDTARPVSACSAESFGVGGLDGCLVFLSTLTNQLSTFLCKMSESFRIRLATAADANIIAWHRARMFQGMGDLS